MSSTAEITRTEWARFGLVLLGLTGPTQRVMAGLCDSWQFGEPTDSSVLSLWDGPGQPQRTKGGRTGVPRGYMSPERVEGRGR